MQPLAQRLMLTETGVLSGPIHFIIGRQGVAMAEQHPDPITLVGTWRRFGLVGPVYEGIGVGPQDADGRQTMHIRVLESGEETNYALLELLDDPCES